MITRFVARFPFSVGETGGGMVPEPPGSVIRAGDAVGFQF